MTPETLAEYIWKVGISLIGLAAIAWCLLAIAGLLYRQKTVEETQDEEDAT